MRAQVRLLVFVAVLLGLVSTAWAVEIRSCFTPGQDCTGFIVDQLDQASQRVLVQAYGMTSEPIMRALAQAKRRGVDVRVLLDKTNEQERYSAATFLQNQGVAVLIDDTHVITGSFNFTKSAQERNAENVLLIRHHPELARSYVENWRSRASYSRPYEDFRDKKDDFRDKKR